MNRNMMILAIVAVVCVAGVAIGIAVMNSGGSDGEVKLHISESKDLSNDIKEEATWKTSDRSVAAVSAEGIITAVGKGVCSITATSAQGKEIANYKVRVLDPSPEEVDVEIIQDDMTLAVGQALVLKAYVTPASYDQTIVWSSSESSIATVDSTGYLTALAVGKCKITAYSEAIRDSESIDITVTEKGEPIPPTDVDVEILQDDMSLKVGNSVRLSAKVTPSTADQTIVWVSENVSVAIVSSDGTVTAIAVGKTEIKAINPASGEDDDIDLIVTDSGKPEPTPTRDIEVSPEDLALSIGDTAKITANQTVSWRSSNTSVATVDQNGNVTAVGNGKCEIIAYTSWDDEDVDVIVSDGPSPPGELEVWPDELNLTVGESQKLNAKQTVSWRSSNTNVATVDQNGNVTAVGNGKCKIVAYTSWDDEDVDVVVSSGPSTPGELEVWPDDLYLSVGESQKLNANQTVSWRSTNNNVATVDQNGNVTAVGKGECEIVAYTTWDDEDVDVVVS